VRILAILTLCACAQSGRGVSTGSTSGGTTGGGTTGGGTTGGGSSTTGGGGSTTTGGTTGGGVCSGNCGDPDCATDPSCVPDCQAGSARPCYSGPTGTSGVGQCHAGVQTCDMNGHWGACSGEVLPGDNENFLSGNCSDGVDNDCNGIKDCMELGCLLTGSCSPTVCTAGAMQACYTGPAGTAGVGPCHGGMQTCASDGKSWGPCMGQVLPSNEGAACADGVDNDCNGQVDCADGACITAANCCVPAGGGSVDDTIWAHSSTDLYKVDPSTFTLTHVGAFGPTDITDIAVTPAGELWAISFSSLYKVDKTTAQATSVAPLSGSGNNGLTFLPNGNLLAADGAGDVKRIDTASGAITAVGNFGNGLSSSGDLVAVGTVMYGISSTGAGGSDASGNNVLLRVDVATGVATIVGPIGFGQVWGLAYVNKRVIAFTANGQIIQIDPATGAGTLLKTTNVQFWGAGMSPSVPANSC
jgi:hypothetical protein